MTTIIRYALGEVTERSPGLERARSMAAHFCRSARLANEAARDLDEGRLPGAVWAEEPDELALADGQIDAREGRNRAVELRQSPNVECVHVCGAMSLT